MSQLNNIRRRELELPPNFLTMQAIHDNVLVYYRMVCNSDSSLKIRVYASRETFRKIFGSVGAAEFADYSPEELLQKAFFAAVGKDGAHAIFDESLPLGTVAFSGTT